MRTTFVTLLCLPLLLHSQVGYYYNGEFLPLIPKDGKFVVRPLSPQSELALSLTNEGFTVSRLSGTEYVIMGGVRDDFKTDYTSDVYHLSNNPSSIIVYQDIFIAIEDKAKLHKILEPYSEHLKTVSQNGNIFRLKCDYHTSKEVLDLSCVLSKTKGVIWCEPEMTFDIKRDNDNPLYPYQYYAINSYQAGANDGKGINAAAAWTKSKGSANLIVAIIDSGVDLYHEDLVGSVVSGYTCGDTSGIGLPLNDTDGDKDHGTSCAGIIGAVDNSMGIKGVASGVKILPVNIFPNIKTNDNESGAATTNQIADAIIWASHHARILSCSWTSSSASNIISAAMDTAYSQNCVVICSAGNGYEDGNQNVGFPASLSTTIAVGAIQKSGLICSYSQRGENIDVVAPGNLITTLKPTIHGKYDYTFSGTSAACPQVAGVAALMLSINPYLTQTQVRQILQNSAKNLGTSGFDTTYGWGLVDANQAVLDAKPTLKIMGSDVLRNVTQYYYIPNLPSGMHVVWSIAYGGPITITNAGNGCLLTRPSGNTNQFLLYAQVYYDDIYIGNASKTIYYDFTATYDQEACAYYNVQHPAITTKPLQPNHTYFVHQGCLVRLNSPFFQGATITHTGITPDLWYHAQNSSEVQFILPLGSGGVPFVVTANCPLDNSTRYFTFFTVSNNGNLTQSSGLDVMATGSGYRISILSLDSGDGILQRCDASTNGEVQWGLEVIDVLTNRQMLATTVQGESYELDTVGWPHGTYAVRAYVGDEPFVTKILVK